VAEWLEDCDLRTLGERAMKVANTLCLKVDVPYAALPFIVMVRLLVTVELLKKNIDTVPLQMQN